jgi:hypothetical protein
MEAQQSIEETTKKGFFSYVFNFDDNNKALLTNLFQYSFLAIPLVVIILKLINYYTPEEDDSKGTLEIIAQVFVSVALILFAIWFINRIVRYIPTASKVPYAIFNEVNFIIPLLIILFTMHTKLGAKINILVERVVDLYDGRTNLKSSKSKKDYKTTQPISQSPSHQGSRADYSNNSMPQPPMGVSAISGLPSHSHHQQGSNRVETEGQHIRDVRHEAKHSGGDGQHNFNQDFSGPQTPLVGAQEPMAANEAFGGNMFGGSTF